MVSGSNLFQSGKPGTYAQYLVVNTKRVAKLPDSFPLKQAVTLPTAGMTAWQALFAKDKGNLTHASNKKVFINGASGGVGSFMVQLAKWAGAEVVTTCGSNNLDYVASLGSDYLIDYRRQNINQALLK